MGVLAASLLLASGTQEAAFQRGSRPPALDPVVLGALAAPVAVEPEPWEAFGPEPAPLEDGPVRVMTIPEDLRLEAPRVAAEPRGLLPGALLALWGLRRRRIG